MVKIPTSSCNALYELLVFFYLIANSLFNTMDLQAVIIIISVATALRGRGRTL